MSKAVKAKSAEVKPIYVIVGKDNFLVDSACERVLSGLIEPAERGTGLYSVDADRADIADVLDELRTLPFLSSRRVVLIKGAEKFVSNNREFLERYFDEPCSTGVFVLTVSSWPKTTRLAKKLAKVGELVSVEELKPWQLGQYVISYAKGEQGKSISKETAGLLVELVGDEPGRLSSEVDKLAMFADGEKSITTKHVESLIGNNRMFNAFTVIDAMTSGQTGRAVERLRRMFAADRSAGYTVVGAFAYHFRRMFNAKAKLEKGSNRNQVASELRIWGDREGFFRQLEKLSLAEIGRLLGELGAIDYAIKTGQATPQAAIEQLVLKVVTQRGGV